MQPPSGVIRVEQPMADRAKAVDVPGAAGADAADLAVQASQHPATSQTRQEPTGSPGGVLATTAVQQLELPAGHQTAPGDVLEDGPVPRTELSAEPRHPRRAEAWGGGH